MPIQEMNADLRRWKDPQPEMLSDTPKRFPRFGVVTEVLRQIWRPSAVKIFYSRLQCYELATDMAADLGAEAAWEPLLWVRSRIIQVAAYAGIAAFDSPYLDIKNLTGLKQEARAAASLGFQGKCAIHPAQIAPINEVLTQTNKRLPKRATSLS